MSGDAKTKICEIIRDDDYCKTRSLEELEVYIECVQEKIHSDDEVRKAVRLRVSRSKEFFQELRPIFLFMKYAVGKGEDVVSVSPALGNQNYDAVLNFRDGSETWWRKIEVTEAIDGYEDSLRMELLNRDGHVSITGPLKQSGTKKAGRTVEIENIAVGAQETADRLIALVENALTKKARKKYERRTWLLVVFDDHLFFKEDRGDYLGSLETMARIYVEPPSSPFERVIIIGQSGAVHGDAFCSKG